MSSPALHVLKREESPCYLTPELTFADRIEEARLFFNLTEARRAIEGSGLKGLVYAPLVDELVKRSRPWL